MSTADELKALGNKALQSEKYEEAIKHYTDAIALDPSNHVLYSNRSAAYAKQEKFEDALGDGEKCVSLNKSWGKGYSRKAAALAYLDRVEEAEECYKEGLKVDPENQALKDGLSEVQKKKQKGFNPFGSPEAIMKLRSDPRTREYLNDPSFLQMLSMAQSNPQLMTSLMQSDPRFMTALGVILGINMTDLGANGDEEMETSPAPSKRSEPAPKKEEPKKVEPEVIKDLSPADREKELGNTAYKSKKFETALQHYDKAIELDNTNMSYVLNKAAVYFEMGDFEKCIEMAEKSIEVGRENRADFKQIAKGFTRIGNAHFKQKNYKSAVTYFEKSLSEFRDPQIVKKCKQVQDLIKEEERLAYIDPVKSEEARQQGNDFFTKGQYPDAIKMYDEAIKRNPDEPKTYCNRAACYIKLGEFSLADRDCDETLKRDSKFIKAYLRKAQSWKTRDLDKAADILREAQSIEPDNKEVTDALLDIKDQKASRLMNTGNLSEEEIRQRAMQDPAVQEILADPGIRMILNQMQDDPKAFADHLKNPMIAKKIEKLMEAGILQMR
ncbi:stress-induced-phosphoprotein 1-like [Convolutriloba macropyga]|uniref:stress-induced-phosphoprotein 1-like n=1 Tax=Convolutriloba macropyga TaxID=536237 RepID=UPI003F51D632